MLAWAILRDGAWLAVVLMVPAAVFSAFFALDASAPRLRAFGRARRRSAAGHLAATFASIVLFWGFFLAVLPPAIAFAERRIGVASYHFPTQGWSPWILFAGASALGLWSGVAMAARGEGTLLPLDGTNRLVVAGPYVHLRNPMVVAGWHFFVRPAEERELAEKFGADDERYRARVPLWWPRLTR